MWDLRLRRRRRFSHGQPNFENGAPRAIGDRDRSAHSRNNAEPNRQTKTGALPGPLGREERFEDLIQIFLGYAAAIVGDVDDQFLKAFAGLWIILVIGDECGNFNQTTFYS